jgi:hypothetical protein
VPHLPVRRFDIAGEGLAVHPGGFFHSMAERGPKVGESEKIFGEGDCDLDEFVWGFGGEVDEAQVG